MATDNFVTNLANLLLYGSDVTGTPYTSTQASPVNPPVQSNSKIYVEYSNETWNTLFLQTTHCQIMGVANFSPLLVTSLTYSGGTCTATTSSTLATLGITNGATVLMFGATDAGFNGSVTVTTTGSNTFTYTPLSTPGSGNAVARTYARFPCVRIPRLCSPGSRGPFRYRAKAEKYSILLGKSALPLCLRREGRPRY